MGIFGGGSKKSSGGGKTQRVDYGSSKHNGRPQTNVYYGGDSKTHRHGHIAISDTGKTIYHRAPGPRKGK